MGQRLAVALVVSVLAGAFFGTFAVAWATRPQLHAEHAVDPAGAFSLADVSERTATHYRHAAANPDVYREVACYCGCDTFADHTGLSDCFVNPGTSAWDAHAAGCGICLEEAAEVRRLLAEGHSSGEIADAIAEEFGRPADQDPT